MPGPFDHTPHFRKARAWLEEQGFLAPPGVHWFDELEEALRWLEDRAFHYARRDYHGGRPTRCTPALFGPMRAELDEVDDRWRVTVTRED